MYVLTLFYAYLILNFAKDVIDAKVGIRFSPAKSGVFNEAGNALSRCHFLMIFDTQMSLALFHKRNDRPLCWLRRRETG